MKLSTSSLMVLACHDASCRPPTSGGTGGSRSKVSVSTVAGDKVRVRKALDAELTAQGLVPMNPLRHIFQSSMGNRLAVVRDESGKIVGGVQYEVSKRSKTVDVVDMRMLQQRSGHGTKAFSAIAQEAKDLGAQLRVYYALDSAVPYYAK